MAPKKLEQPIERVTKMKLSKPFVVDDDLTSSFQTLSKKIKPSQPQEKPQEDYLSKILEGTREPV